MRLEHIVGLSGPLSGAVQWSGDGAEVVFPSGNVVIAMGADARPGQDLDGSTTGKGEGCGGGEHRLHRSYLVECTEMGVFLYTAGVQKCV
jgi:hypothetical protein